MPESTSPSAPILPRWQCHKIVAADRIVEIVHSGGHVQLTLAEGARIRETSAWDQKHVPMVGGYFVRYDDDYHSYSPADAFEAGYTRIPEAP